MHIASWKSRYSVLSVVFATYIIATMDKIAMSVAIPYIATDLQLGNLEIGAVMSAFFISYSISQVPGGLLADRFGARKVATTSMAWWSAFTAVTGVVTNLHQLLITRFVFGLGEGMFPGCAFKTVATWFPRKERATANGLIFSSNFLGAALAPLIVVAIIAHWGWRPVFFALCIPGLIMAVLFWIHVPNHPADSKRISADELREIAAASVEETAAVGEPKSLKDVLTDPNVIKYFLIYFLFDFAFWGFTTWLPTYLVKARGFSMAQMGLTASLPFFAGTLGCVFGGWLSDRYFSQQRRVPIIASQLAAAALLYLMFNATSTAALVAFQTVTGLCLSLFFGTFWALPLNTLSSQNMGVAGGFINMAGQMAAIVAPLVIGYLVDASAGGFMTTFACLIAALLASSAIVLSLPGRRDFTGVSVPASRTPL